MRVIVAEDGVMRGLLVEYLLGHGIEVIGQAATTQELLGLVDADPPQLVTVDFGMPRRLGTIPEYGAGLDAAKEIRRRHPHVAILALSQYTELSWAQEILSLGTAVGYQLKDRVGTPDQLLVTMREVAEGAVRIDGKLTGPLLRPAHKDDPLRNLSKRQREILELIAQGWSNHSIGKQLCLTESTVEGHVTLILRSLGIVVRPPDGGEPEINGRVMAVLEFLKPGLSPSPGRQVGIRDA
ncbi:response regulator transcription factor [Kutzneria buriramensis]|uniref:DNA-binding NarL/FixJ family response regulator n=1 Tax=Kutzneria buriramensis TaxID=1045776 RepID=A0A3E0H0S8_9PSEU|nr:response regulator transcription factor [Kutzneria buriramensis]REH36136.1 DNA-binding NarL/FixJ family response regulator [Kutzneria buriramensis]